MNSKENFNEMVAYDFSNSNLKQDSSGSFMCDGSCYSGCNNDCYADSCDQGGTGGCNN